MRPSVFGLIFLCFGLTLAQDEKRLRLRRPRPFKDIDNVDGIEKGRPVPLKIGRADSSHFLVSAFEGEESQQRSQQANAALESLLATAGRSPSTHSGASPSSQEAVFEEVAFNQRAQFPRQQQQQQQQRNPLIEREEDDEEERRPLSRTRGRTRLPPQVPRRRPSTESKETLPTKFKPRKPSVKTTERYSNENEDGSFTFGYVSEDGSFREETRGVDCITRGKYGYIDPEGKKREFTYVSGLPCDTPEDGLSTDDEDSLQRVVQDPVNPAERFRTSNPVQLSENDLPKTFIRNRQRVRRPQPEASSVRGSENSQQEFPSFNRDRVRPPTQAPTRRPLPSSGALNNLFAIVDDKPTEELAPRRPVTPVTRRPSPSPSPIPSDRPFPTPSPTPSRAPPPSPTPTRRPSPTPSNRPSPTPSRRPPPPTQGNFNFQSSLADFENRRPAITFDPRQQQQQNEQEAEPVGPNFSSELSFNPESGTFQTDLRQNFGGQEELRLSQPNAPSGHSTQAPPPSPQPSFTSTTAATPFASFSTTAASTRSHPRPTSSLGTPSLSFQPLEFPDPGTVKLPEPPVDSPEESVFFQPFPSSTAAPPRPQVPSTTSQALTSFPATPTASPVRTLPPNRPPPPQNRPPVPPPPQPFISNPRPQFAFNPALAQSQQSRPAPFTAFASGTPPQLTGSGFGAPPPPSIQFQQQQQQRLPPQSFQSFPTQQQVFPQQSAQPGARFLNAGRPTPPPQQSSAASAPFAVFNPAAFAGIRGA